MILSHDGLDRRWEHEVSWKTLNPNNVANEEDIPPHAASVEVGRMIFEALSLIDNEKDHFNNMRALLANHLHFTYWREGLSWPRPRTEILPVYNELPSLNFPLAIEDLL